MGSRAERVRREIQAGGLLGKRSMSSRDMMEVIQGGERLENRLTGGRKVERAKIRRGKVRGEIERKIESGRQRRLEEAIKHSRHRDWQDDDLTGYIADARRRINGTINLG